MPRSPRPPGATRSTPHARSARSHLRAWSTVAIAITIGVILLLTLTPLGTSEQGCALGLPCVLGHVGMFTALGASLGVWFAASDAARRSPRRTLLAILFAVWLFAALDEMAQEYVGRDASAADWAADMAGTFLGLLGSGVLLRFVLALRA